MPKLLAKPDMALPASKKAINRAGDVLRDRGPIWTGAGKWFDAIHLLERYRACWQLRPSPLLTNISMNLRSRAKRFAEATVSQRLKRVDRIIEKLERFPKMQLARMDDIGGCRVVFGSLDDLRHFEERFRRTWQSEIIGSKDYIATPKVETGYRAVHIIVERRGLPVEIQLRTAIQHRWAMTVESAELITGAPLKDGGGPPGMVESFRLLSELEAYRDMNQPIPMELINQLRNVRGST
jgi:putative GTP pyrophosphokinase